MILSGWSVLTSKKQLGSFLLMLCFHPETHSIKPWTQLSAEERRLNQEKWSFMLLWFDNLDYQIGQVIQYLKASGQLDNTVIVFMSDNGAAAEDFYNLAGGFGPLPANIIITVMKTWARLPLLFPTDHSGHRQVQHHLSYLNISLRKAVW